MKLRQYLDDHSISAKDFGEAIGRTEHAVKKWLREERIPGKDEMAAIFRETCGAVQANDFHGQPALRAG